MAIRTVEIDVLTRFDFDDKIVLDYKKSAQDYIKRLKGNEMPILSSMKTVTAEKTAHHTFKLLNGNVNGLDTFKITVENTAIQAIEVAKKLAIGSECELIFNPQENNKLVNISYDETALQHKPDEKYPDYTQMPKGFVGSYYVDTKHRDIWDVIGKRVFTDGHNLNIMAHGASGYGKTSFFQALALHNNVPCLIIDCATMLDNGQWFGKTIARNGSTEFIPSEFVRMISAGNCVIVFDELNRVFPEIHNTLFPLFDHRGRTDFDGYEITRGKRVLFGATENVGMEYVGTQPLDKALRGRFDGTFPVGAIPDRAEGHILSKIGLDNERVDLLIKLFAKLRAEKLTVNVSTRTSMQVAGWMQAGLNLRKSFDMTMLNDADNQDKKIVVDMLNLYEGVE